MLPEGKEMFTDDDYRGYFNELERNFKNTLTIYTDLLNDLDDRSIRSKFLPILSESMEAFKFMKEWKKKFLPDEEK